MKLEFGNQEHIDELERMRKFKKARLLAFKRSGLTLEQFLLKREIRYWMNPTKSFNN